MVFFGRFSDHTVENKMKSHEKAEPIESEYILINFMGYNNIIRLMTPVLYKVPITVCMLLS